MINNNELSSLDVLRIDQFCYKFETAESNKSEINVKCIEYPLWVDFSQLKCEQEHNYLSTKTNTFAKIVKQLLNTTYRLYFHIGPYSPKALNLGYNANYE